MGLGKVKPIISTFVFSFLRSSVSCVRIRKKYAANMTAALDFLSFYFTRVPRAGGHHGASSLACGGECTCWARILIAIKSSVYVAGSCGGRRVLKEETDYESRRAVAVLDPTLDSILQGTSSAEGGARFTCFVHVHVRVSRSVLLFLFGISPLFRWVYYVPSDSSRVMGGVCARLQLCSFLLKLTMIHSYHVVHMYKKAFRRRTGALRESNVNSKKAMDLQSTRTSEEMTMMLESE